MSVSNFLQIVNSTHQGYLSDDVIRALEVERRGPKVGLFSARMLGNKGNESLREQAAEQQYDRWVQEAEDAKRVYGDFDLGVELQDPRFRKLLQSGISVPDAYL